MKTNHLFYVLGALLALLPAQDSFAGATKAPKPPTPPARPPELQEIDVNVMRAGGGAGGAMPASPVERALVILNRPDEGKVVADTEEDLLVMNRILEKAVDPRAEKSHRAMGIVIQENLFRGPASPRSLYLEGYGALFFLTVNYPLVPPAAKGPEPEPKDETSTEWEETRRELYQAPPPGFTFDLPDVLPFGEGPGEEFNKDRVEDLKTDLIQALKNAAHIRQLKPEESVTVVVTGRSGGPGVNRIITRRSHGSMGTLHLSRTSNEGRAPKLILRATKTDIADFQKGELSAEAFRGKVTVTLN